MSSSVWGGTTRRARVCGGLRSCGTPETVSLQVVIEDKGTFLCVSRTRFSSPGGPFTVCKVTSVLLPLLGKVDPLEVYSVNSEGLGTFVDPVSSSRDQLSTSVPPGPSEFLVPITLQSWSTLVSPVFSVDRVDSPHHLL